MQRVAVEHNEPATHGLGQLASQQQSGGRRRPCGRPQIGAIGRAPLAWIAGAGDTVVLTTSAFVETFLGPARVELGRTLEAPAARLEDDQRLSQSVRTFYRAAPLPLPPPALQVALSRRSRRSPSGRSLTSGCLRLYGPPRLGGRRRRQFRAQYDTYLGFRSAEDVLECVRKCWSSNWRFSQSVVSALVSPDHFWSSGRMGPPGGADRR